MSDERKPPVKGDVVDVLFGVFLIAFGICVGLPTIWDLSMTVLGRDNWLWRMWHHGAVGSVLALVGTRFFLRGIRRNNL